MDAPAGMDPLQWARYDAAMQRYRDTVAAHRATFESELRRAKDALAELNRRDRSNGTASATGGRHPGVEGKVDAQPRRVRAAGGPVQSILTKGG